MFDVSTEQVDTEPATHPSLSPIAGTQLPSAGNSHGSSEIALNDESAVEGTDPTLQVTDDLDDDTYSMTTVVKFEVLIINNFFFKVNEQGLDGVSDANPFELDLLHYPDVIVTNDYSRPHAMLWADSKSWNAGGIQHTSLSRMPSTLHQLVRQLRPLVFDNQLSPLPWTIEFMRHSRTTLRSSNDVETGRVDIRVPLSQSHSGLNIDAVTVLNAIENDVRKFLQDLGLRFETVDQFVTTDVYIHVAFSRCQRTDFITTGHSNSKPFEEILVLIPFTCGKPLALWDQSKPCHRDGTPESVIPELSPNDIVVLTNTPYALLSTTVAEVHHVGHAFIVVRLSLFCGYIVKVKPILPPFDATPEKWLLSSTTQPPIRNCVLCKGRIRERRHGDLSGDRSRTDHGCSLPHCHTCRKAFPSGPYSLCEFCVITKLGPCEITNQMIHGNTAVRFACSNYFSVDKASVCVHQDARINDLVSTLFLLIHPRELQAAAKFFKDFFTFGTWHDSFAPPSVLEAFKRNRNRDLWNSFYQEVCANAHCPRVRLVCYAMQCALNTGPVLRHPSSSLRNKSREIYFRGKLSNKYNTDGFLGCVLPRTMHAAAMAEGLFDLKSLQVMSIRVFKVLNEPKFTNSFCCCCSSVGDGVQDSGDHVLRCRGPSLDLSSDVGQDHLWKSSQLQQDSWAVDNLATLRHWQKRIRQDLSEAQFQFNDKEHIILPIS